MSKKKLKQELKIEFQNLKNNPVAKFAHRVNRAEFFRDHTVYLRKSKHKNNESFRISFSAKNEYEKACVVFCNKNSCLTR